MEPLVFDSLEPKFVPVTIAKEPYKLYELTEDAALARDALRMGAASMVDGKFHVNPSSTLEIEPVVVSKCLFKCNGTGEEPVPLETVKRMPHEMVEKLFNNIVKLSPSMRVEPDEEAVKKGIALMKEMAKN